MKNFFRQKSFLAAVLFLLTAVAAMPFQGEAAPPRLRLSRDGKMLLKVDPSVEGKFIIPDGVTAIGERAFFGCRKLESVTIPAIVTTIESGAFYKVRKVEVASGNRDFFIDPSGALITRDGKRLIYFPVNFEGDYVIPKGISEIGEWAFAGCWLKRVTIPDSVTQIGKGAFLNCDFKSVAIPNSVTTIGEGAFASCFDLKSVTIPNSVTTIGDMAFIGCKKLKSVTIPNSVTTIGDRAFNGCTGLESITIPNSVTTIGDMAFFRCEKLKSVTIPNSVKKIEENAFADAGCEEQVKRDYPHLFK